MLSGATPFSDEDDDCKTFENIIKNEPNLEGNPILSASARELLGGLMCSQLDGRLGNLDGGADDITGHAWFAGFGWQELLGMAMEPPWSPKHESADDTRYFDHGEEEDGGNFSPVRCSIEKARKWTDVKQSRDDIQISSPAPPEHVGSNATQLNASPWLQVPARVGPVRARGVSGHVVAAHGAPGAVQKARRREFGRGEGGGGGRGRSEDRVAAGRGPIRDSSRHTPVPPCMLHCRPLSVVGTCMCALTARFISHQALELKAEGKTAEAVLKLREMKALKEAVAHA